MKIPTTGESKKMTETIEPPPKPKSWLDSLTPEAREAHLAKMRAGRKRHAEKTRTERSDELAMAPPAPHVDPEKEELRRRLAAAEEKLKIVTPDVATLPPEECFFEFRRKHTEPVEKITTSEDPRWDEMSEWQRVCEGTLIINALTRNGFAWDRVACQWKPTPIRDATRPPHEVIDRVHRSVLQLIHGEAREAMRRYERTGNHFIPQEENKAKVQA